MNDPRLHVVIPYFNHANAGVNRRNLELCLSHLLLNPDCRVVLVEGSGNREAELPDFSGRIFRHLKFDLRSPIWVKENLINLGIASLGDDWEAAAWIDKDIQFLNPDWAKETLLKLQESDLLQPWSRALLLDGRYEVMDDFDKVTGRGFEQLREKKEIKGGVSFCRQWLEEGGGGGGHPGFSWAISRRFYRKIGKIFDRCLVGGGDAVIPSHLDRSYYREYFQFFGQEYERYRESLRGVRLSVVGGTIIHLNHGELAKRKYRERYAVLRERDFEFPRDLSYAPNGTLQLNNPGLESGIMDYFLNREEHLVP